MNRALDMIAGAGLWSVIIVICMPSVADAVYEWVIR